MSRKIFAYRPTHAVVNASNLIKDNMPWHILVDGEDCGKLKKDEQLEIEISNEAHEIKLRAGLASDKCTIAAGTEDYALIAFNESMAVGYMHDAFSDMLCAFVVEFSHSREFAEMMQKDCLGKVNVFAREDYLEFTWEPEGLMATLFGKNAKKIPYVTIGAVAPPDMIKTTVYTRFLAWRLADAVHEDPQGRYHTNSDLSGCGSCKISSRR